VICRDVEIGKLKEVIFHILKNHLILLLHPLASLAKPVFFQLILPRHLLILKQTFDYYSRGWLYSFP